nr:putative inorganic phosphate cotransporter [Onthophagus taurus]
MVFLLTFISFGMKVNLSIGIVAITDDKVNPGIPTFHWNTEEKGLLLSAIFVGYVLPQIFAGILAKRYGSKWILTFSMGFCALFTCAIPKSAEFGVWACILCRFLQGFCQGFFFPCVHNLISLWIPCNERSTMGSFIYSGCTLGIVIGMLLTGELSASIYGWPSAFYIYALFGFIWMFVWAFFGESSPKNHKNISIEEKLYIINSYGYSCTDKSKKILTPWKEIFISRPFWGLLIVHCGQMWSYFTLMNELPTYMNTILKFDIKENGVVIALAYFVAWIASFPFAIGTDFIINRKMLSIGNARKIATSIGLFGPAIIFLIISGVDDLTTIKVVVLIMIGLSMNSATLSGFQLNHIDISQNHAGTLMGITNSCANLCGIITPIIVDIIVVDEYDSTQWDEIFLLSAGIYLISGMFYIAFGSGEIQEWDKI